MTNIAIYPGSFDPITNGHISILKRASHIFDKIIVAISYNDAKKNFFSMEERVELVKQSVKPLEKIKVKGFDGLLVNFCKNEGSNVIIRGLRAVSDFDYEFQLALANRRMDRSIETVFLMTDYKYSYLSSSLLRSMAGLKGNIDGLAPVPVIKALQKKAEQYGNS